AHREIAVLRLESKARVGIARAEIVERHTRLRHLRVEAVVAFHLEQGKVFLPRFRRSYLATDKISGEQAESFDLRRGHIDVVGTSEVAVVQTSQKAVAL